MKELKKANKELALLKEKYLQTSKGLLYKRVFRPAYSDNFEAEVFPSSILIEALKEVASNSDYCRWAYNESVQGMASGEVQFDIINWELSTAYYTTGSFDDNPEIITIYRFDQNTEANSDFDLIEHAIGIDYDEIIAWIKKEFEQEPDETEDELLYRISGKEKFHEKVKEITGQSIEEWKEDYFCEDAEIDWDYVFENYNQLDY